MSEGQVDVYGGVSRSVAAVVHQHRSGPGNSPFRAEKPEQLGDSDRLGVDGTGNGAGLARHLSIGVEVMEVNRPNRQLR